MVDLEQRRRRYGAGQLDAEAAGVDPTLLLRRWLEDALGAEEGEPSALALATVAASGTPSVRYVLCRGVDDRPALRWYTGLDSRKAREARAVPRGAASFWWPVLERQVRVVGAIEDVPRDEAAAYFRRRPRESQLGAAASLQSRPARDRGELEHALALVAAADPNGLVAMPAQWGGLALVADEIEFWQGRAGRLHDRIVFLRLDAAGTIVSAEAVAGAATVEGDDGGGLRRVGVEVTDGRGVRWLRVRLQP